MAEIKPEFFCELPRYRQLTQFRNYLDSKQYEGRADFFTGLKAGDSKPVPLRERKPCIIYPLPRSAVNQVVRFTFGESRFPTVNVEEISAESSVAGESLSKENADVLTKFISAVVEACDLKPAMRRLMRAGMAVGTTVPILSIKRGVISIEMAGAEDILPEFKDNDPTAEVTRAVWSYQYTDAVPDDKGHPQPKRFWFRRDITADAFVEYERVEVKPNESPTWRPSRTVPHGFGFCPVIWIRNVTDADSRQLDGCSLYDNLLEEFDALNLALSQRHRGINLWGVPQPWETGVEEDDGPQATGRLSRHGYSPTPKADAFNPGNDIRPHGDVADQPARPVSPANQWTYRSEKAQVGLLETTGKAFEAGTLHVNDIRSRALEAMSVVLVNVSDVMNRTAQNQMSAKFLELAYEPLLALVDEMRHCWWPSGLRAILSAILRIVAVRKGEGIYISGAKKAAEILQGFFVSVKAADGAVGVDGKPVATELLWMPPKMTPVWGDYFSAGAEEIKEAVETATKARDGRLVPEEDAAKFVLHYFGREDIQEALEAIEADKRKAADAAVANAENEAKTLHAMAATVAGPTDPGGDMNVDPGTEPVAARARGRKQPKKPARGRSGGAAPASEATE